MPPRPTTADRKFQRASLIDRKRAACREDFNKFRRHLLRDKKGKPLPDSPYAMLLSDTLVFAASIGKHVGHMAPQGLGKSTLMRALLVWRLGNDPTRATVVISAEQSPAARQVAMCRKLILASQFRHVFPDVIPDRNRKGFKKEKREDGDDGGDTQGWRCEEFFFRNAVQSPDPAMSASAAVPKTEARRVNDLLADDLMSRTVAASAAMKKEMIEACNETWLYGRLSNGGWAMVTHNCWDSTDLLHTLKGDARFIHLWCGVDPAGDCERMFVWLAGAPKEFPLLANPKKYGARPIEAPIGWDHAFTIPLPPNRPEWAPEYLRALRDAPATSASFAQFHGLRAQEPEDLVFQGWANRAQIPGTAAGLARIGWHNGFPTATPLDRMRLVFGGGLDLSGTGRRGIVLTLLARELNTHRAFPIFHRRYNDLEPVMADLQTLWDNGVLFRKINVENNGVQSTILQFLSAWAKRAGVPWQHRLEGFLTGNQKGHPDQGLPGIDAMLRSGELVWPAKESQNKDNPNAGDWRQLEREMASTTREQVAKPGQTPDSIMSLWFSERALETASVKVSAASVANARRKAGSSI